MSHEELCQLASGGEIAAKPTEAREAVHDDPTHGESHAGGTAAAERLLAALLRMNALAEAVIENFNASWARMEARDKARSIASGNADPTSASPALDILGQRDRAATPSRHDGGGGSMAGADPAVPRPAPRIVFGRAVARHRYRPLRAR